MMQRLGGLVARRNRLRYIKFARRERTQLKKRLTALTILSIVR